MKGFEAMYKEQEAQLKSQLEFSFRSDEGLAKATKWFEQIVDQEAAEQFTFVLKTMQDESFVNHCDEATKLLGMRLNEHWGDEESFFDLVPEDVQFMEIRSLSALKSKFRRDDYHSIGLMELPQEKDENKIYVACDLVYGSIAGEGKKDNVLLLHYEGEKNDVLDKISEYYGGNWKVVNTLNKKNKNFKHHV